MPGWWIVDIPMLGCIYCCLVWEPGRSPDHLGQQGRSTALSEHEGQNRLETSDQALQHVAGSVDVLGGLCQPIFLGKIFLTLEQWTQQLFKTVKTIQNTPSWKTVPHNGVSQAGIVREQEVDFSPSFPVDIGEKIHKKIQKCSSHLPSFILDLPNAIRCPWSTLLSTM